MGRIFGIEIGLHYSWLIIALLITFSLAQQFYATNREWGAGVIWISAVATGLLFFTAIILHELSHALVAKARGLPVRSITLFALGGLALIEKDAEDAKTEFWMGLIGPVTSFLIGLFCLGLAWAAGWRAEAMLHTPLTAILMWLGVSTSALRFQLNSGLPLDGGRVLRACIWWVTGNPDRATRIAAQVGQLVAFGFILLGIFRFFGGAGIGGLWIAFIGWFLLDAARASYAQGFTLETLRGVRVGQVMASGSPAVDSHLNLRNFVDEYLLRTGRRSFVVEENGQVSGSSHRTRSERFSLLAGLTPLLTM